MTLIHSCFACNAALSRRWRWPQGACADIGPTIGSISTVARKYRCYLRYRMYLVVAASMPVLTISVMPCARATLNHGKGPAAAPTSLELTSLLHIIPHVAASRHMHRCAAARHEAERSQYAPHVPSSTPAPALRSRADASHKRAQSKLSSVATGVTVFQWKSYGEGITQNYPFNIDYDGATLVMTTFAPGWEKGERASRVTQARTSLSFLRSVSLLCTGAQTRLMPWSCRRGHLYSFIRLVYSFGELIEGCAFVGLSIMDAGRRSFALGARHPCAHIMQVWEAPAKIGDWVTFTVGVGLSSDPAQGFIELWMNGEQQTFTNGAHLAACVHVCRCIPGALHSTVPSGIRGSVQRNDGTTPSCTRMSRFVQHGCVLAQCMPMRWARQPALHASMTCASMCNMHTRGSTHRASARSLRACLAKYQPSHVQVRSGWRTRRWMAARWRPSGASTTRKASATTCTLTCATCASAAAWRPCSRRCRRSECAALLVRPRTSAFRLACAVVARVPPLRDCAVVAAVVDAAAAVSRQFQANRSGGARMAAIEPRCCNLTRPFAVPF